jgi:hypothetical protein
LRAENPDLEVGDAGARDMAAGGEGLERRAHGRMTEPREHAGVDEMRQRHAAARSPNLAFASVTRALATRRSRVGAAQGLIDRVLQRLRAELGSGRRQRLLVDVLSVYTTAVP